MPDGGVEPSAFSCIDSKCVWECGGGRTCQVSGDGGCLLCGPPAIARCAKSACTPAVLSFREVEDSTCPGFPEIGARITITTASNCWSMVYRSAGADYLGTWVELSSGEFLGTMPGLGGTCVGQWLPTGAMRVAWSCPLCQFVVLY